MTLETFVVLAVVAAAGFFGGAAHALLTMWGYGAKKGKAAAALTSGAVGLVCAVSFFALLQIVGGEAWAIFGVAALAGYVGADIIDSLYVLRLQRSKFLR